MFLDSRWSTARHRQLPRYCCLT